MGQTKMSSFSRQLGMYGFHKIVGKTNKDKGSFFHELFLRGRPGLCRAMARLKKRSLLDPDNEPDLYAYPPMMTNNNISVSSLAKYSYSPNLDSYSYNSSSILSQALKNNNKRINSDDQNLRSRQVLYRDADCNTSSKLLPNISKTISPTKGTASSSNSTPNHAVNNIDNATNNINILQASSTSSFVAKNITSTNTTTSLPRTFNNSTHANFTIPNTSEKDARKVRKISIKESAASNNKVSKSSQPLSINMNSSATNSTISQKKTKLSKQQKKRKEPKIITFFGKVIPNEKCGGFKVISTTNSLPSQFSRLLNNNF